MGVRDELLSTGLGYLSINTLTTAKGKYDRGKNEQKVTQLSPFTYETLTKTNAIRLLKIIDGPDHDAISCSVFEVSLDDNPEYEALSYTWKIDQTFNVAPPTAEPAVKAIICNGKLFHVQLNLYHALARFRRTPRPLPLWVDQVCIDQTDPIHKLEQIALMGRIYSTAQAVLVWLGKTSTIHDLAINAMARLVPVLENNQKDVTETPMHVAALRDTRIHLEYGKQEVKNDQGPKTPEKEVERSALDQHADAIAVMRILRRGWFSRTWTLQELLLARNVVICMGDHEIPQDRIVNSTRWLLNFYSSGFIMSIGVLDEIMAYYGHLLGIPAYFKSRKQFLDGKRWSLEEYTAIARTRAVTEPKDKVYAGLSLVDVPLPQTTGTTAEVYTSFSKELYEGKAGATSLSLVGDRKSSILDLPSWVPDLSVSLRPNPLRYTTDRVFNAATSKADIQKCNVDGKVLTVQAAAWDTVTEIGESILRWFTARGKASSNDGYMQIARTSSSLETERIGLMFSHISKMGPVYKPTGEPSISAMCHSLLAGMYSGEDLPPKVKRSFCVYLIKALQVRLDKIREWWGVLGKLMPADNKDGDTEEIIMARVHSFIDVCNSPEYPLSEILEGHRKNVTAKAVKLVQLSFQEAIEQSDLLPFISLFEERYSGRRLFITKSGYIGVGVESVRPGDSVMLVAGADTPYIFRPVECEEKTYSLVGEAYVHGIMQGEAVQNSDTLFERIQIA